MMRVLKFAIPIEDTVEVAIPRGAQVLTVQLQRNTVCIWALCVNGAEMETRTFRIAGTGHEIDPEQTPFLRYIDSVQLYGGELIFHVFEVIK